MRNTLLIFALPALALTLQLACGGSTAAAPAAAPAPGPATGLTYADPAGSGWRLVKDGHSTATRLVLDLKGPAGTLSRGAGFNLQAPAGLVFDTFSDGQLMGDPGVYELDSLTAAPGDPVAAIAVLKPGNLLSAGIFQKRLEREAKDSGQALLQIALKLDPAAKATAGQSFALTMVKARIIPEDIGAATDSLDTLGRKMRMQDVPVALGSVKAN